MDNNRSDSIVVGNNKTRREYNSRDMLGHFVQKFRGKKVFYFPNPGNAGDSVIAAATYQFFEHSGIDYCIPNPKNFDPYGKIVFYGGGGNLIGDNTYSYHQISKVHTKAEQVIILPHTIKDIDHLMRSFGSNVTIFCREKISFDYVTSFNGKFQVFIDDDMAFRINTDQIVNTKTTKIYTIYSYFKSMFLHSGHTKIQNLIRMMCGISFNDKPNVKVIGSELFCFRRDGEKTEIAIPDHNYDLSTIVDFGVAPREMAMLSARMLFDIINNFETIHTNRLHIAISSAILGKKVFIYANNYYKVRAVYEYSMKDRFQNVIWADDIK